MLTLTLRNSWGLCVLALLVAALLIACEGGAAPSTPSGAEEPATESPATHPPESTPTPEATTSGATLTPKPTPTRPTATVVSGQAQTTPPPTPGPTARPAPAHTSPETDRAALVAIYQALGGDNWIHQSGWLSDGILDDWQGVEVDENGRVYQLWLSRNNLTGSLPPELWELSSLKELRLDRNPGLTGRLPPEVGNLVNLEQLWLQDTRLSGELPEEIGNLVSLGDAHGAAYYQSVPLEMSGTRLCVPPGLEEALHSKLSTGYEYRGVLCDERGRLEAIYHALGGENWNDKSGWLSGGILDDWQGVEVDENGRVYQLWLSRNNLTGSLPPELWELSSLKELRLDRNPGLSGCIPAAVQERLGPGARPFGSQASEDDPFCAAGSVRTVPVTQPGSTPAPAPSRQPGNHRDDLRALRALYNATGGSGWTVKTNWLDESKPLNEWHGVMTNGEGRVFNLNLAGNGLSGEIPADLRLLSSLLMLNLNDNRLTGLIPSELAWLTKLNSLHLRGNSFDGEACVPRDLAGRLSSSSAGNPGPCPSPEELRAIEVSEGIKEDLEALKAIYMSTSETEWGKYLEEIREKFVEANKDGWSEDCHFGEDELEDLSQWCGVTTNDNGRVIKLDFGGIGELDGTVSLKGSIPSELGNMDELQVLDLSGGSDTGTRLGDKGGLTGAIPASLGNLPKLEVLNLSGNKLGGTVPVELADLFNTLDVLDLAGNALVDGMSALLEVDVNPLRSIRGWIQVNVSDNDWAGDEGEYWKEFEGEITRDFVDLTELILTKKYPKLGVTNVESLKDDLVKRGVERIKARAVSQIAKGATQSTAQRVIASVLIRGTTTVLKTGGLVGWVVFAIDAGKIAFSVVSAGLEYFEATAGAIARRASENIWGGEPYNNFLECVNAPGGGTSKCKHLLEE